MPWHWEASQQDPHGHCKMPDCIFPHASAASSTAMKSIVTKLIKNLNWSRFEIESTQKGKTSQPALFHATGFTGDIGCWLCSQFQEKVLQHTKPTPTDTPKTSTINPHHSSEGTCSNNDLRLWQPVALQRWNHHLLRQWKWCCSLDMDCLEALAEDVSLQTNSGQQHQHNDATLLCQIWVQFIHSYELWSQAKRSVTSTKMTPWMNHWCCQCWQLNNIYQSDLILKENDDQATQFWLSLLVTTLQSERKSHSS